MKFRQRLLSRIWRRPLSPEEQIARMREDWERRATENPLHFIATANEHWDPAEFYASGEQTVRAYILSDRENICQGRDPKSMRVLELGCGAGRETRALAGIFGEVHAVDISAEMVRLARDAVGPFQNAFIHQNNGMDLSVVPDPPFDFAYSYLVFQHIQSLHVIRSYIREVHRLLRAGSLFKFQVQGIVTKRGAAPGDTWFGFPFTEEQILQMARDCGFESRYRTGVGQQDFWNWFFKPEAPG
jgi:SAM-dependent methyltransferase